MSYLASGMDDMSQFMSTYQAGAGGIPADPRARVSEEISGDDEDALFGELLDDEVAGVPSGNAPAVESVIVPKEPSEEALPSPPPRVTPSVTKPVNATKSENPTKSENMAKPEKPTKPPVAVAPPHPPTDTAGGSAGGTPAPGMYSVGQLHCMEQSVRFFEENMYKTLHAYSAEERAALRGEVKSGQMKGCKVAFLGEPLPGPETSELELRHVCWLTYPKEGPGPGVLVQKEYAGEYRRYLPCVYLGGKFHMIPREMQQELFGVVDVDVMMACQNLINVVDPLRGEKVKIPLVPCHVLTKKKDNRIRGGGQLDVPAQKKAKVEEKEEESAEDLGLASMDDIEGIDFDAPDKTVRRLKAEQLKAGFSKLNGLAPGSPLHDYELLDDDMVAFACHVPEDADIYGRAVQDDIICGDGEMVYEDVTEEDIANAHSMKAKQKLLKLQQQIEKDKAVQARRNATKKKKEGDEYRRAGGMNVGAMKQFLSGEKNHDTDMFRGTPLAWGKFGYRRLPGSMPADFDTALSAWALEKQYAAINPDPAGAGPEILTTIDNALWEYAEEQKKRDADTPYDFEAEIVDEDEDEEDEEAEPPKKADPPKNPETSKKTQPAPADPTKHKKADTMQATKPLAKKSTAAAPAPTASKKRAPEPAPADDDDDAQHIDETDQALATALKVLSAKRAPAPAPPPAKKSKPTPVALEEGEEDPEAAATSADDMAMLAWAEEMAAPAKKQSKQHDARLAQLDQIISIATERVGELEPQLVEYNEKFLAAKREYILVEKQSKEFLSRVEALHAAVETRRLAVDKHDKLKQAAQTELAKQRDALRRANAEIHDIQMGVPQAGVPPADPRAAVAAAPTPTPKLAKVPAVPVAAAVKSAVEPPAPAKKKAAPRVETPVPVAAVRGSTGASPSFVAEEVAAYIAAIESKFGDGALKEITKRRAAIDRGAGDRIIKAMVDRGDDMETVDQKQVRKNACLLPDSGLAYAKLAGTTWEKSFRQVGQFCEYHDPEGVILPLDVKMKGQNLYKLFVSFYNQDYPKGVADALAKFTQEGVEGDEKLARLFENLKVRVASIYLKMRDAEMRAAHAKQNGAGKPRSKGKKGEEEDEEVWGEADGDKAEGDDDDGQSEKDADEKSGDSNASPRAGVGGFFRE